MPELVGELEDAIRALIRRATELRRLAAEESGAADPPRPDGGPERDEAQR